MEGFIFGSPWGSRRGWREDSDWGLSGFLSPGGKPGVVLRGSGIFSISKFPGRSARPSGYVCVMGGPVEMLAKQWIGLLRIF